MLYAQGDTEGMDEVCYWDKSLDEVDIGHNVVEALRKLISIIISKCCNCV